MLPAEDQAENRRKGYSLGGGNGAIDPGEKAPGQALAQRKTKHGEGGKGCQETENDAESKSHWPKGQKIQQINQNSNSE